jgi:hypothetical protein
MAFILLVILKTILLANASPANLHVLHVSENQPFALLVSLDLLFKDQAVSQINYVELK